MARVLYSHYVPFITVSYHLSLYSCTLSCFAIACLVSSLELQLAPQDYPSAAGISTELRVVPLEVILCAVRDAELMESRSGSSPITRHSGDHTCLVHLITAPGFLPYLYSFILYFILLALPGYIAACSRRLQTPR
ncbi:uncharacterized protein SCHCODRAFT_02613457 [Schizophyllum commune H4-8]|uniref:uncharacterized protein n=1 Tax=Schizophyllum commune (strain H4-8 / FGSC 9210) TaxID=578458 RepID=UPI002160FBA3|nr:uncharacterized protein SCHCODRAFT_02613429 [Schizophyllum commune H4-8]XP_050202520.1 uncharacterized protein SCHCODRAFT_02613457 [Schizophyllum commune H4-8]KAI5898878.1 hypothetical protein SCHCODRAFT_02613429 [Schizophyllum commune H4-8]KAI5898886.1 hypothetical protein SCHCODRAFT_02613457 [Schizophyllum commune H4-8]